MTETTQQEDQTKQDVVSFENEPLILVDSIDRETGTLDKASCHDGEGILHRAFSLFIFNTSGQLLLQQRASEKRLWPGYWSNSCCSHPRAGESMEVAISRRLDQELGMSAELSFAYKFEYQASYKHIGSEHELCSVYLGTSTSKPQRNTNEIDAYRWVNQDQLESWLTESPEQFTPWFKMEWQTLHSEHMNVLGKLLV